MAGAWNFATPEILQQSFSRTLEHVWIHLEADLHYTIGESNVFDDALSQTQVNPVALQVRNFPIKWQNNHCVEPSQSSSLQCRQALLATNAGTMNYDFHQPTEASNHNTYISLFA